MRCKLRRVGKFCLIREKGGWTQELSYGNISPTTRNKCKGIEISLPGQAATAMTSITFAETRYLAPLDVSVLLNTRGSEIETPIFDMRINPARLYLCQPTIGKFTSRP